MSEKKEVCYIEKYKYIVCEEDESQYNDYDLSEQKIVPARYVKAKLSADEGNPFIEAMPYPRSEKATMMAYTRSIPGYSYDKTKSMSKLEKMLQVGLLRNIRFPLPFHKQLEFDLYNALLTSYRARNLISDINNRVEYVSQNQVNNSSSILIGDSSAATNAGFSLIGYSGCGKSSAINVLVSHYPQVIMHEKENGSYYPQITYLVVNCIANSNFSALYQGIGDAIDKAFGNIIPVYSLEISKTVNLGKKAEKIKEYIEKFSIGIIILDEIQLIDFEHTRENTFDSLLNLANRTKAAIAVVGTEDARDKMFRELRTSRRIGTMVNGNLYCNDKKYFVFLVKNLFHYQWFDKPIELTDEIVKAMTHKAVGCVLSNLKISKKRY